MIDENIYMTETSFRKKLSKKDKERFDLNKILVKGRTLKFVKKTDSKKVAEGYVDLWAKMNVRGSIYKIGKYYYITRWM